MEVNALVGGCARRDATIRLLPWLPRTEAKALQELDSIVIRLECDQLCGCVPAKVESLLGEDENNSGCE